VEGVALAAAISDWRGEPVGADPGRLDADGGVALLLGGSERGSGKGQLELREGRLPAGSLFDAVLGMMGRLTGRMLSVGSAARPEPSRLERLTASWQLRAERLHSSDLELVTDDYVYRGQGSLGLDGSLGFDGRLQLNARGLQRMLASAALPLPGASAAIPVIPLSVRGSLGAPSITADAARIPAAAVGILTGWVKGGAGLVEGAARAGKGVVDKVLGR